MRVSSQVVFTTHTPVPAGHDRFPADMIEEHLGPFHETTVPWLVLIAVLVAIVTLPFLLSYWQLRRIGIGLHGQRRRGAVDARLPIGSGLLGGGHPRMLGDQCRQGPVDTA